MGGADQVRTVQAAYASFARNDLPGLLSLLSDRVIWDASDALWVTGTFFGHDGVRDYFGRLEGMWDELRLEDYEIEPVRRGTVLVRGRLRGRERASGQAADSSFLHWLDVGDDGRIARMRILVDPDRRD